MERIALFYLVVLAGFIMVAGGMWLLYKQKIYLDSESKQPISVETPIGKFTSNYPALALFALGFFPLIYPIYAINNLTDYVKVEPVRIRGLAQANAEPILVYAARADDTPSKSGDFRVTVPFLAHDDDYKLLLIVNGRVLDQVHVDRKSGQNEIVVNFKPLQIEPSVYKGDVAPIPADFK